MEKRLMGMEQQGKGNNCNGNPRKSMQIMKWVSDLHWRLVLLLFSSLFIFLLMYSYGGPMEFNSSSRRQPAFYSSSAAGRTGQILFDSRTRGSPTRKKSGQPTRTTTTTTISESSIRRKGELTRSRIAVCLVGGARRFELTGPSIMGRVLNEFPNSDVFLNSPLDSNSFKLSLLNWAHRVKSVRIFEPGPIPESDSRVRVLTAANSPNGIQGLLQYFNLVEGCLTMIEAYQKEKGFTYDWIVRTRVDGYWSAPLDPSSFVPGRYVVPPGSTYGGLNDRFGAGDYNTSVVALSRLSLIPILENLNYTDLNSETAFKAQLAALNVSYRTQAQPFCIVTDRTYSFPPGPFGVPVAALSSRGPINGAKCRPCRPVCVGPCLDEVMPWLKKGWSWTPWRNDTLELCDAHGEWEVGWEEIFDEVVGPRLAQFRKKVGSLNVDQCVKDFKEMKRRAVKWDTPPLEEICKLGLDSKK